MLLHGNQKEMNKTRLNEIKSTIDSLLDELEQFSEEEKTLTKNILIEIGRNSNPQDKDYESAYLIIQSFLPRGRLFCRKLSDIIKKVPSRRKRNVTNKPRRSNLSECS